MDLKLKDRVVLVTGSSRGIGRAIAEAFLAEGASVVLTGRNRGSLNKTTAELSASYPQNKIMAFCGDLFLEEQIGECLQTILKKWKKLHILVVNIGSGKPEPDNSAKQEISRMKRINFDSAVTIIEKTLSNNNSLGSIVCIASIAGIADVGASAGYAKAKAQLIAYCRKKSVELAKRNIRLNIVSPGNINFPGGRWEEIEKQDPRGVASLLKTKVPLQRFGTPQEIAATVLFLASERSSFTTGSNIIVDGGQIAALSVLEKGE